jgi:23S rRNA pseudouridine1911/1915/1917 synthase
MDIVYEDEFVIILNKLPGISSQPDFMGEKSLLEEASEYLGLKVEGTFIINRLDKPVGGLIMFAKSREAAGILSNGEIEKRYLTVVNGDVKGEGILEDYLFKDARLNISRVVDKSMKNAKYAKLFYRSIKTLEKDGKALSALEVQLFTGRHHQIRAQLSYMGHPIWGDNKYNDIKENRGKTIALFSYYLSFNKITAKGTGERMVVTIPAPDREPFSFFVNLTN